MRPAVAIAHTSESAVVSQCGTPETDAVGSPLSTAARSVSTAVSRAVIRPAGRAHKAAVRSAARSERSPGSSVASAPSTANPSARRKRSRTSGSPGKAAAVPRTLRAACSSARSWYHRRARSRGCFSQLAGRRSRVPSVHARGAVGRARDDSGEANRASSGSGASGSATPMVGAPGKIAATSRSRRRRTSAR